MSDISQLLASAGTGDFAARSELFPRVYAELRRLAADCMRAERPDHTLQATALVNEAFLRLTGGEPISWESRAHFLHCAGRVMRQILVDHARHKSAQKRGGDWCKVNLEDSLDCAAHNPGPLSAIDDALHKLAQFDARAVSVVELRFFAGLSISETARTLAVSDKTVCRDWEFARVFLEQHLRAAGA